VFGSENQNTLVLCINSSLEN